MTIIQRMLRFASFIILYTCIITISSCGSDDPEPDVVVTTVAEDRQNIQNSLDAVVNCIETFKNGPAVDVLFGEFLGLSGGEVFNEEWIDNVHSGLNDIINLDNVETNKRFDINFYAGTYTFNIASDTWSKANDQNGKIVFKFPSSPEQSSNNAIITISNYSDEAVTILDDALYLPKTVSISLDVDGTNLLAFNLNNVSYASNADFEIPVQFDLDIFMNPMTFSMVLERSSTLDYHLNLKFSDDAGCDMGVDIAAQLKSDDFENLSEDDIEKITVVVHANDLKIQSLNGIADLLKMDDPSENDINTLLNLDVLFKDIKIADLKLGEGGETVVIFYKDGTSEDTSNFYDGFVEDIKNIFNEFFGS